MKETTEIAEGEAPAGDLNDTGFARASAEVLFRWRTIAATTIIAMIVAIAVILLLPERYTARTVLYLPQTHAPSGPDFLAGQLPAGLMRLGSSGGQDSRMISMFLESRTLLDSLKTRHGPLSQRNLQWRRDGEGSIVIDVIHRDPETAATIANSFPPLLNALALRASAESNERRMSFLRMQLEQAQEQLAGAEGRLVLFQQAGGMPDVEEQGRRTIDAAIEMQRRIIEKEVEIAQLRRVVTPDNPRMQAAQADLAAWRLQLRRLTGGTERNELLLSLEASPEIQAEAYRLARDFQVQEQVVLSLTAALTQAQLDSRNDLPMVNVIDPAIVPEAPSGPPLPMVAIAAALLGFIAACIWVVIGALWSAARQRPANRDWFHAWDRFRADLRLVGSRKTRPSPSPRPTPPEASTNAFRS